MRLGILIDKLRQDLDIPQAVVDSATAHVASLYKGFKDSVHMAHEVRRAAEADKVEGPTATRLTGKQPAPAPPAAAGVAVRHNGKQPEKR